MRKKQGFTLAELLIVITIIAVLVGIAIPIFSKQLEQSRRAVDMANARNIIAAIKIGMNSGDIEFDSSTIKEGSDKRTCIAIVVSKDGMNCFVSGKTKIDGITYNSGDNNFSRLKNYLKKCGIENYTLSSKNSNNDGWAFYTVFIYSDGSSRIGSGIEDNSKDYRNDTFENHATNWLGYPKSNIEKAMGL